MPPGINRQIAEGFDLSKVKRKTTVLAISAVAFTAISIAVPDTLPYLLLFWAFVLTAELSGKAELIFGHPAWKVSRIWKPIILGVSASSFGYSAVLLLGSFQPQGDWRSLLMPTLAWGVMVGVIETFGFHWTLLATLPYAPLTSNALFAALHPLVRSSLGAGNPAGFYIFLSYFMFGIFMTVLVMMYERSRWFKGSEYFGPMLAVTLHCAHNVFVVIFAPSIGGMQLAPY